MEVLTMCSVLMTVLWSSFFILLLYFLWRKQRVLDKYSISGVVAIYSFCLLRLFVPIEVPWVQVVECPNILNPVSTFLRTDMDIFGMGTIKIWQFLIGAWILMAGIGLLRLARMYYRMGSYLRVIPCEKSLKAYQILKRMQEEEKNRADIVVVKSAYIKAPISAGIWHTKILLPDKEYSGEQLEHIIRHEYAHIKNKDLLLQLLANILCAVYWWNPFVYLLRQELERSFEMRCDQIVVEGMSEDKIAAYLETLLMILENRNGQESEFANAMSLLGRTRDKSSEEIKARFEVLVEKRGQRQKRISMRKALSIMLAVFGLSYAFIFQPAFEPPMEDIYTEPGVIELTPENTYFRHYEDGTYILVSPDGEEEIKGSELEIMLEGDFTIIEMKNVREDK